MSDGTHHRIGSRNHLSQSFGFVAVPNLHKKANLGTNAALSFVGGTKMVTHAQKMLP